MSQSSSAAMLDAFSSSVKSVDDPILNKLPNVKGGLKDLYIKFKNNPDAVARFLPAEIKQYLTIQARMSLKPVAPRVPRHMPEDVIRVGDVKEIQEQIKIARHDKKKLRVLGSVHSRESSVYEAECIKIVLAGRLKEIISVKNGVDEKGKYAIVKVGGGCYLGVNPADPQSNSNNSLITQLAEDGYALPVIGGIAHQTIAGYMQTGSAGGSTAYGIADCIESFRFVNGLGDERKAHRNSDLFKAAGVSMGLMGVITEVTLKVYGCYAVEGQEDIREEQHSWLCKIEDKYPLEEVISQTEYAHINWFPHPGVNKVIQWYGRRVPHRPQCETPIEYENILESKEAEEQIKEAFGFVDLVRWYCNEYPDDKENIAKLLQFVAILLNSFLSSKPKPFKERWDEALPTEDKTAVDTTLKVHFTEVWAPVKYTEKVIDTLKEFYKKYPVATLGTFTVEIYGAKKSPFWLSPACEGDVVRVDPLWWYWNEGEAELLFREYWNRLLPIEGATVHWGKHIPKYGDQFGDITFNRKFLKNRYPHFKAWLEIREEMDPENIFVTQYWHNRFFTKLKSPAREEKLESPLPLKATA